MSAHYFAYSIHCVFYKLFYDDDDGKTVGILKTIKFLSLILIRSEHH